MGSASDSERHVTKSVERSSIGTAHQFTWAMAQLRDLWEHLVKGELAGGGTAGQIFASDKQTLLRFGEFLCPT
jgi:hypothetical protein